MKFSDRGHYRNWHIDKYCIGQKSSVYREEGKNTPEAGGPASGGTTGGIASGLFFLRFGFGLGFGCGGGFLFRGGFLLRCCGQCTHLLSGLDAASRQ